MKKVFALLTLLLLLLSACAATVENDGRAEAIQARFAAMSGCAARFDVAIPRGDETVRFALSAAQNGEETRLTVLSPEELDGIVAVVRGKDALTLEYEGTMLDAGGVSGDVSGVTAFSCLLRAIAEGYVTERNGERFGDADALRLCFETEKGGETLLSTVYFDANDAPLYAEIEQNGEILAYLEFTAFDFGDIMTAEQA